MNRNNLETIALRARDKARSLGARVAAGATALTGALASTAVMASSNTIGQTASTQITGAKSDVELVQTAMLGVLIVLVVFGLIRKSFGK
jgi:uncharacterized transporter YbjL